MDSIIPELRRIGIGEYEQYPCVLDLLHIRDYIPIQNKVLSTINIIFENANIDIINHYAKQIEKCVDHGLYKWLEAYDRACKSGNKVVINWVNQRCDNGDKYHGTLYKIMSGNIQLFENKPVRDYFVHEAVRLGNVKMFKYLFARKPEAMKSCLNIERDVTACKHDEIIQQLIDVNAIDILKTYNYICRFDHVYDGIKNIKRLQPFAEAHPDYSHDRALEKVKNEKVINYVKTGIYIEKVETEDDYPKYERHPMLALITNKYNIKCDEFTKSTDLLAVIEKTGFNYNMLYMTAYHGNTECVRILLKYIDESDFITSYIGHKNKKDLLPSDKLLKHEEKLKRYRESCYMSAYSNDDIIEIDNKWDPTGLYTSLYQCALKSGYIEIVKLLGPRSNTWMINELSIALKEGYTEIVRYFLFEQKYEIIDMECYIEQSIRLIKNFGTLKVIIKKWGHIENIEYLLFEHACSIDSPKMAIYLGSKYKIKGCLDEITKKNRYRIVCQLLVKYTDSRMHEKILTHAQRNNNIKLINKINKND